jgi:hypothetical protein
VKVGSDPVRRDKSVPRYVRHPVKREPDFGVTDVNYDLCELLAKAEEPE